MRDELIILIPTKDDHQALASFIRMLNAMLVREALEAHLMVVDDGSRQAVTPKTLSAEALGPAITLSVIRLRRNLGHQRAIALGLAYIHDRLSARRIVIMDGDGEDRADDVPRLLAELERSQTPCVVFAARTRRSESMVFLAAYHIFRVVHRILVGIPVRFGNFSVLPFELVSTLVIGSELWNHYAAAVLKLGLPYRSVPTERDRRIAGQPRMNTVALVVHGLSAISVFGEVVGARLLMVVVILGVLLSVILGSLAVAAVLSGYALPAWPLVLVCALLVLVVQLGTIVLVFVFVVLGSRASTNFIPARDYRWFVEQVISASPLPLGDPR